MSKGLILKILLCGFVVFLLLPVVYDEEESTPAGKTAFEEAATFNPSLYEEDEEGLPILEGAARPKGNILTRYVSRFKKVYGKALFGSAERGLSDSSGRAASLDDNEDLYYAMAALFNSASDKEGEGGAKSSYYKKGDMNASAYDKDYLKESLPAVKQITHDNAPVKGLYEASSVEPYETRSKAKQVYSNVMDKVDRYLPAPLRQKNEEESSDTTSDSAAAEEAAVSSNLSGAAFAEDSLKKNDAPDRIYTGISSPASRGGKISGYKYSSGGKGESSPGFKGSFEAAVSRTETYVSAAKDIMREEKANNSGGASKGEALAAGQENDGNQPDGGAGQYYSYDDNNESANGNNPFIRDIMFDQKKYDGEIHDICEDDPSSVGAGAVVNKEGVSASEPEEDKIESLCATPLEGAQWLEDTVKGKNIIVDLGMARGRDGKQYRVVPTFLSLSSKGLGQIGISEYYDSAAADINMGHIFKGADPAYISSLAGRDNSIVITVSPALAERYLGKSVLIEQGDLESKKGLRKLSERVNNLPAESARILALKKQREEAAAQARKKEVGRVKGLWNKIKGFAGGGK